MKRRLEAIAIGVLFCFLAFACSSVKEQGISEYHKANSSTGITLFLLPDDNFLQEFSYVEGDCDTTAILAYIKEL